MKQWLIELPDDFEDMTENEQDHNLELAYRKKKEVIDWQPQVLHERWEGKLFKLWATEEKI